VSPERFLGGRVAVRQSAAGFRAGLDAVMLAASVPATPGDKVLELGAGAGTASLCLAERVMNCKVVGIEIDPDLTQLARANAQTNRASTEFVCADIFDLPQALKHDFNHVFCNPPFHEGEPSPDAARDRALRDVGRLGDWIETGLKRTASNGSFTLIIRADRLIEALAALPERGTAVFPLWPRRDEAAKRVIVQARKGSRAALVLLPGLVLHAADGTYTPEAEAVLRDAQGLKL